MSIFKKRGMLAESSANPARLSELAESSANAPHTCDKLAESSANVPHT